MTGMPRNVHTANLYGALCCDSELRRLGLKFSGDIITLKKSFRDSRCGSWEFLLDQIEFDIVTDSPVPCVRDTVFDARTHMLL